MICCIADGGYISLVGAMIPVLYLKLFDSFPYKYYFFETKIWKCVCWLFAQSAHNLMIVGIFMHELDMEFTCASTRKKVKLYGCCRHVNGI